MMEHEEDPDKRSERKLVRIVPVTTALTEGVVPPAELAPEVEWTCRCGNRHTWKTVPK